MMKILLVDDDEASLSMFGLFMGAYGYHVLTARSGREALQVVADQKPPIVFTDIKMPGMDGLEVLRRIKQTVPETEVIVITGHGDMDLAVKALDLEATDFINKPIQRTALDSALERAKARLERNGPAEIHIQHSRLQPEISLLEVRGDVKPATVQLLAKEFESADSQGIKRFIVHFDRAATTNRDGIRSLVQLLAERHRKGHQVILAGVSDNFQNIFHWTGISRYATLTRDIATAQGLFSEI